MGLASYIICLVSVTLFCKNTYRLGLNGDLLCVSAPLGPVKMICLLQHPSLWGAVNARCYSTSLIFTLDMQPLNCSYMHKPLVLLSVSISYKQLSRSTAWTRHCHWCYICVVHSASKP